MSDPIHALAADEAGLLLQLDRPAVRVLAVRLPLAPSVNELTMNTSKHSRRVTSPAVTKYKGLARRALRQAIAGQAFAVGQGDRYRLTLFNVFNSARSENTGDADNRIKAAQDIIAACCGFDDKAIFDVRSLKAGIDPFESYTIAILERFNGQE